MTTRILDSNESIRKLSFEKLTKEFSKKNPDKNLPSRFDLAVKGPLKLRVGARASNYYYRTTKQTEKLGDVRFLTLQDAKKMVSKIEANEEIESLHLPFSSQFEKYITFYQQKSRKHNHVIESIFKNHLEPAFGNTPTREITTSMAVSAIEQIQLNGGPSVAQKALSFLKRFFKHQTRRDILTTNPVATLMAGEDFNISYEVRTRHLNIDEVHTFIRVLNESDCTQVAKHALTLQTLLLSRIGELELAEWSDIHLRKMEWHVKAENTKSKRATIRPLSAQAVAQFKALKKITGDQHLVLGGLSKNSLSLTLKNLQSKLFDEDFRIHDLRKTGTTICAAFTAPHILDELLSHKKEALKGTYNQFDYLEDRASALQSYANMVFQSETMSSNEVQNTMNI